MSKAGEDFNESNETLDMVEYRRILKFSRDIARNWLIDRQQLTKLSCIQERINYISSKMNLENETLTRLVKLIVDESNWYGVLKSPGIIDISTL